MERFHPTKAVMGDEQMQLIRECIAHLSGPGAYFSARQRLALSLEAAAVIDACPDCAAMDETCIAPGQSVLSVLKKNAANKKRAMEADVPEDLSLCIRLIANVQSKLTKEFYMDLVQAATEFSTLSLTKDEKSAAAAEVIAVVSVACSLTTLIEVLSLTDRIGLPKLKDLEDKEPIEARRLSSMGSTVAEDTIYGPVMGKIGSVPAGEALPMMLPMMPFKGIGLVPFEALFFSRWMASLYMEGWKVILAAYKLGARTGLTRAQMEVVAEHYTGAVACSY